MEKTMITICIPCGYIYKAEQAFESLPGNWCCPDCGASIDCFDMIDESLADKTKSNEDPSIMALGKSGKI